MPISQERELEIEQELAAIVRELERGPPMEKRGPKKPETSGSGSRGHDPT